MPGLHLITSGHFDAGYAEKVARFSWVEFFRRFGAVFTVFREMLSDRFEYVLVDSRTGVTDVGGICSMVLPEKLVGIFTPNAQSLDGLVDLVGRAIEYRKFDASDFRPLAVFPLPCRVDLAEKKLREKWRERYQRRFETAFRAHYELSECNLLIFA